MRKRKILGLVLALAMAATAFVGCKDNTEGNAKSDISGSKSSDILSEDTSGSPDDGEEEVTEVCNPFTGEARL